MIDLTNEVGSAGVSLEQDAVQKAIAESLRDTPGILGGQISREEQEISRYLVKPKYSLKKKYPVNIKYQNYDFCWFKHVVNSHDHLQNVEVYICKFC